MVKNYHTKKRHGFVTPRERGMNDWTATKSSTNQSWFNSHVVVIGPDEETEKAIKNMIKENKLVVDTEEQRQGYPIDKQYVEERLKEG